MQNRIYFSLALLLAASPAYSNDLKINVPKNVTGVQAHCLRLSAEALHGATVATGPKLQIGIATAFTPGGFGITPILNFGGVVNPELAKNLQKRAQAECRVVAATDRISRAINSGTSNARAVSEMARIRILNAALTYSLSRREIIKSYIQSGDATIQELLELESTIMQIRTNVIVSSAEAAKHNAMSRMSGGKTVNIKSNIGDIANSSGEMAKLSAVVSRNATEGTMYAFGTAPAFGFSKHLSDFTEIENQIESLAKVQAKKSYAGLSSQLKIVKAQLLAEANAMSRAHKSYENSYKSLDDLQRSIRDVEGIQAENIRSMIEIRKRLIQAELIRVGVLNGSLRRFAGRI